MTDVESSRQQFLVALCGPICFVIVYSIFRIAFDKFYHQGGGVVLDVFCRLSEKYSYIVPKIGRFSNEMKINADIENIHFMKNTFFANIVIIFVSLFFLSFLIIMRIWPRESFMRYVFNNSHKKGNISINTFSLIVFILGTFGIHFLFFESSPYALTRFGSLIYHTKYYVFREVLVSGLIYVLSLGAVTILAANFRFNRRGM